jgi:LOB domain-containing protein 18
MPVPAPFNISNLPSATNVPTTADLSALFDTPPQAHQWAAVQQQHHHQHQHQQHQLRQASTSYGASVGMAESSSGGGGGDLQALARELLDRHRSGVKLESPPPPPPHSR